ncbi:hypothetical protein ACFHWD_11720 [Clostridium sp. MT-14]|uniref:hypothetical protein n=1 Tax=unclassified Clostridium TaxID=2614128 RepID=UPI00168404A8|nr:hypothetical protein [Clostridium sp. HV4-5-A1G]
MVKDIEKYRGCPIGLYFEGKGHLQKEVDLIGAEAAALKKPLSPPYYGSKM